MTKPDSLTSTKTARRYAAGCFLSFCLAAANVVADEAADFFSDANRAFQTGDYKAAIELYGAADNAGHGDLALFYNLGVCHYKVGQYTEAKSAFVTASTSTKLAPLAYYNLGLVARKTGDVRNARGWFEQAIAAPGSSSQLQDLAKKALGTMAKVRARKRPDVAEREARLSDFLSFRLNSGYASDSNIYRTPGSSYVDLASPGAPMVDPVVQSGTYIPIEAEAQIHWDTEDYGTFELEYSFDGRLYSQADFDNANTFKHQISFGGRAVIPTDSGYRYWRSHFAISRYDEQYYDRDDGQDQMVGTVNVSDRFGRTKIGPDVYYHRKRGWLGYGFRAEGYINNYENGFDDTLEFLDLTHEQYLAGVHVSWYPLKSSELRLGYDVYRREYLSRKAKDSNGIRFTDNAEQDYDYTNYALTWRQRFGRNWSAMLDYRFTNRVDLFEAYDDYDRHTGRASVRFRGSRFNAKAGVTYRIYDFPNAYTFDLIAQGERDLNTMFATLEMSYRIFRNFTIEFQAQKDIVDTSDPRSEYQKDLMSVNLAWSL